MKQFTIDINFCTSVTIHKEYEIYKTDEEKLVARLKYGTDKGHSTWSEDHPEFAKLRNLLETEGYVETRRNCWNGDTVLKTFQLNKKRFNKGDQFPCAAAIKWKLEH